MSIEANTYQELTIKNTNEKTAAIAVALGEYLKNAWGLISLSLHVDGNEYSAEEDEELSGLSEVFDSLRNVKEINMAMRICDGGGLAWRLESSFMSLFFDDEDIRKNVTYKSTDYYDTDTEVMLYRFGEAGGEQIAAYTEAKEDVADIKEWYCYTPELRIEADTDEVDSISHEFLVEAFRKICDMTGHEEDDLEDVVDDCWEDDGEMSFNPSMTISAENIPELIETLQAIADAAVQNESAEFSIYINALPCGEGVYEFAATLIEFEDGKVTERYCRF